MRTLLACWTIFLVLLPFIFAQTGNITPEPIPIPEIIPANITFYIEHKVHNTFVPRTRIQLIPKPDGKNGLLYLDKNTIHGDEVKYFKSLVQNQELYTIRIRSEKDDFKGSFVTTSMPVCDLQKSNFKEDIQAFLDNNGNIIGVSYTTPKMTIAQECDPNKIKDSLPFQTRIKLGDEFNAQVVPLQFQSNRPPYLASVKLGLEEEAQQPKPQQSFLSRYWYIFLIFMVFSLLGGGGTPEQGKEGAAPAPAK